MAKSLSNGVLPLSLLHSAIILVEILLLLYFKILYILNDIDLK